MTPQPDNHIQKSMSDSKDSLSYFRTNMPLIPCMQQIKLDCVLLAQRFGKGEGNTVAIYSHSLDVAIYSHSLDVAIYSHSLDAVIVQVASVQKTTTQKQKKPEKKEALDSLVKLTYHNLNYFMWHLKLHRKGSIKHVLMQTLFH